ncbi:hypothetical protein SL56_04930 [Klebsiella pneumoniae]|uniref:DUF2913 family protein n=1 Tax=Klebsiella pneumoniae TaxID=573 RepID=UPI0006582616|nr:DUF2913 family protein [Klebsiella pneumoniae]KMB34767.1 hypothetical protein SL56_04930 [Klebsiella pneumoniae]
MAWCALVALHLARKDGAVNGEAQESLFMTRWLATALKQKRFPREVAPDIEWLLKQGRLYGVRAKLTSKLEYLWHSCTGEISAQSDLFRLTYAIETAKSMQWTYRLLSDREWSGRHAVPVNPVLNCLYLAKSSLDAAFDDDGRLKGKLLARITGNIAGLSTLLSRCGWKAISAENTGTDFLFGVSLDIENYCTLR